MCMIQIQTVHMDPLAPETLSVHLNSITCFHIEAYICKHYHSRLALTQVDVAIIQQPITDAESSA